CRRGHILPPPLFLKPFDPGQNAPRAPPRLFFQSRCPVWFVEGGVDMPHYQDSLYKDLLSLGGHPFPFLQSLLEVDADAPESAIRIALKDMHGNVRDWSVEAAEKPLREPTEQAPRT